MPDTRPTITLSASPITIEQVVAVAQNLASVKLDTNPAFVAMLDQSVAHLEKLLASDTLVYGVTTGFGASCETIVPEELSAQMAMNLSRFHGCGTGVHFNPQQAAAITIVRLASLTQGRSGVRPILLQRLVELLNKRILPHIPSEGSVGASGDLTPLSYIVATLIGEREVSVNDKIIPAAEALKTAGLSPLVLRPKESLAIMNGTSVMTGLACLAFDRARRLSRWAAALTAMASDVTQGNRSHFDARIFEAKPHPGQLACARWIASDIQYTPGQQHIGRIQDRYSIRCAPHVIGVMLDSLPFLRQLLETELNSSNDNPLLDIETGDVLHGGNFYGGHPCLAMDILKNTAANLADLADRQMALICNPDTNHGLPADLVMQNDAQRVSHHGFKAMQITASALAAEALKLTMPASVFSRSTESHNQDKVSMGTIASREALRILDLTETVCAVLQLALCQAVDIRKKKGCHQRSLALHEAIRQHIPANTADRRQDGDIVKIIELHHTSKLPVGEIDFVV